MSRCQDDRFSKMLHRYELDLLSPEERQEFELHLLECEACFEEIQGFREIARHLNRSEAVRRTITDELEAAAPSPRRRPEEAIPERSKWRSIIPISIAAAAVLVLMVFQPWQIGGPNGSRLMAGEGRLLVLPFENLADGSDEQRLGEVISQLLITDLSQSRLLDVISGSQMRELLNLARERRKIGLDLVDPALLAAEKSYATWVLRGTIIQRDPSLVLTVELSQATGGDVLESQRIEAEPGEDMFALVDRLTISVKDWVGLSDRVDTEADEPVSTVTTTSYDAYRYYIEGTDAYARFEYGEAETALSRAIELDSTFAMAYCYLAALGHPELIGQAVKYSDRATERERLFIGSLEASFAGDPELRAERLRQLLEKYPNDHVALLNLASHEHSVGHNDKAIALAKKAIQVDPLYKSAFSHLTYWLATAGKVDEALVVAEEYIAIAPAEPIAYYTKADLLSNRGDLTGATQFMEKACSIDSTFLDYGGLLRLGSLYVFGERSEDARRCFQIAAAEGKRKTRSTARTYLALIPAYHGKLSEALNILDDGITADKMELSTSGRQGDRADKHFIRSLIYLEKGDMDRAIAEHEEALNVHAEVVAQSGHLYRSTFAYVLSQAGELKRAEEIANVLKSEFEAGHVRRGTAYHLAAGSIEMARGQYDKGIDHLRESVQGVDYPDHTFIYARALFRAGRYEEAIPEFESLLNKHMDDWTLVLAVWLGESRYYLGYSYETTGQREKAIASYGAFLEQWAQADSDLDLPDKARARLTELTSTP